MNVQRKYPVEQLIEDMPPDLCGSLQEMPYWRAAVDRAHRFLPYWDKIDLRSLRIYDIEIHDHLAEYEEVILAADAISHLTLLLTSRATNPNMPIADKLDRHQQHEVEILFKVLSKAPGNMDYHYGTICIEEAIRTVANNEMEVFFDEIENRIDIPSFRDFEESFNSFVACEPGEEANAAFNRMVQDYDSFVEQIKFDDDAHLTIGFEPDAPSVNFEDLAKELARELTDLQYINKKLSGFKDNLNSEDGLNDDYNRPFHDYLDMHNSPLRYVKANLKYFPLEGTSSLPTDIDQAIVDLRWEWKTLFNGLRRKFPFLHRAVGKAESAFTRFDQSEDSVQDACLMRFVETMDDIVQELRDRHYVLKEEASFDERMKGLMEDTDESLKRILSGMAEEDRKRYIILRNIIVYGGEFQIITTKSKANQEIIREVLNEYWGLLSGGFKKRNALTEACVRVYNKRKSDNLPEFAEYANSETLRNACDRELKEQDRIHGGLQTENKAILPDEK